MRNIKWLETAERELQNIIQYVSEAFGSDFASRIVDDIMLRVDALGEFPYLGTIDSSIQFQGLVLYILHERHLRIYYTVTEKEILIVLLWNNRRDDHLLVTAIETALRKT